jgi:uncharacterized phiE125 gp8 family phage protein
MMWGSTIYGGYSYGGSAYGSGRTPLKLITPPPFEPLTLAQVKEYFRVDHSDEDDAIARCFSAAVGYVDGPEGFLQRALIDQTWELTLDAFPMREIRIPLPPLIEVVSVNYDDGGGNPTTLDPSGYSVDNVSEPGWIVPVSNWPSTFNGINAVRIRYRAGYVDTSMSPNVGVVPDDITQALLIYAITVFDQRGVDVIGERTIPLTWSAEQLLRRRRVEVPLA